MIMTFAFAQCIIRLHLYHRWRLLFLVLFFIFFTGKIFQENYQKIHVRSPSWPIHIDPVSVTLTYFSRSQSHLKSRFLKLQNGIIQESLHRWTNPFRSALIHCFQINLTYFCKYRSKSRSTDHTFTVEWSSFDSSTTISQKITVMGSKVALWK